jgi:hypothetical protein
MGTKVFVSLAILLVAMGRACSQDVQWPGQWPEKWWLKENLRVVCYEFLEGARGGKVLSAEQIMAQIEGLGGADVILCKGYEGGDYSRFSSKIRQIFPAARAKNMKLGVFCFTNHRTTYRGGSEYEKSLNMWKEYVDMGAEVLFVDEESGTGDIPGACLEYCDELKARFKVAIGIFPVTKAPGASGAPEVAKIAQHVDVIGEMGYSEFLDAPGIYNLAETTRKWLAAARGAKPEIAYWTGAGMFGPGGWPDEPGTPKWKERYGDRDVDKFFCDYMKTALDSGATGVYYHSICRTTWWKPERQEKIAAGVGGVFRALAQKAWPAKPAKEPAREELKKVLP